MIGRGARPEAVIGRGSLRSAALCLTVGGGCCGVGRLVGRVGAQILEGLLALGDELFERCEQQLGGRRAAVGGTVGREGWGLPDWVLLQAGAPTVGRVGALGAGATGGAGVQAPAAARTAIHGLQEETVSGAAARRAVAQEVLLVQEILHFLLRWLLQLTHKKQSAQSLYSDSNSSED